MMTAHIAAWCLGMLTGVFLLQVNGDCNVEELELDSKFGEMKPKQYAGGYYAKQYCLWKLPYNSYATEALFIHIKLVDMRDSDGSCTGDLMIGPTEEDNSIFCDKPRANCHLYGKNISQIDPNFLAQGLSEYEECTAWHIDPRPVKAVTFRSFGSTGEFIGNKRFLLEYKYVKVKETGQSTLTSRAPAITTLTTKVSKALEAQENQVTSAEQQQRAISCQTYYSPFIAAVAILILLILVLLFYFAYKIYRKREAKQSANLLVPVASVRSGYVSNEMALNDPYATIGDDNAEIQNQTSPTAAEVPTTSSVRPHAPSTVSEPYYQVPNSQYAFAVDSSQNSDYALASDETILAPDARDVYAMVNKDRSPTQIG